MKDRKIIAYKGFNNDMTCRGFKYEVGKEYEHKGEIIPCEQGFHACQNPLDVLDYYEDITNDRFCLVVQSGKIENFEDKTVSSKIKIYNEIGFTGLFKEGVEWLNVMINPAKVKISGNNLNDKGIDFAEIGSSDKYAKIGSSGDYARIGSSGYSAKMGSSGYSAKIGSSGNCAQIGSSGDRAYIGSSGDCAQIGSSGDYAQIGSSGNYAKIGSSGNCSKIYSTGEDSVICCVGAGSIAKAKKGSWITLAEWGYSAEKKQYIPKCVKAEYVDGERIKEDTWYKLVGGEFKELT